MALRDDHSWLFVWKSEVSKRHFQDVILDNISTQFSFPDDGGDDNDLDNGGDDDVDGGHT